MPDLYEFHKEPSFGIVLAICVIHLNTCLPLLIYDYMSDVSTQADLYLTPQPDSFVVKKRRKKQETVARYSNKVICTLTVITLSLTEKIQTILVH